MRIGYSDAIGWLTYLRLTYLYRRTLIRVLATYPELRVKAQ